MAPILHTGEHWEIPKSSPDSYLEFISARDGQGPNQRTLKNVRYLSI